MLSTQKVLLMSRFVEKKYGITFWKQILWIIYSVFSFADLI